MKKVTRKCKKWTKNEQKILKKKQKRLKGKQKTIRKKRPHPHRASLTPDREVKTVIAPKNFNLVGNESREELLLFIEKIKKYLFYGYKIDISFAETETLIPCGTLWATAQIERLIALYPNQLTCDYPEDDIVEQLFQHIGLLQKLGLTEERLLIDSDNVRYWHYVEGTSTDDVSHFSQLFKSITLSEELSSGLFDSMSEAVTNTVQHAYDRSEQKEWRMFAQKKDGRLEVAICDLGIGIPRSLRQKPELKDWLTSPIQTSKRNKDTTLLELAIQSSRSKTKLPHRGKGLKEMLELVKNGKVGGFRVFSGRAFFDYNVNKETEMVKHFKNSINGTLIQWQIPLENDYDA